MVLFRKFTTHLSMRVFAVARAEKALLRRYWELYERFHAKLLCTQSAILQSMIKLLNISKEELFISKQCFASVFVGRGEYRGYL